MNAIAIFFVGVVAASAVVMFGIVFFSTLKYIKKRYFPSWTFLDYVSVGYVEYLVNRLFNRNLSR